MLQKKSSNCIMIVVAIIVAIVLIICGFSIFGSFKSGQIAKLEINCNGEVSSDEYAIDEAFTCKLGGKEYEISVASVEHDAVNLQADSYGLIAKNKNGTINLTKKTKDFKVTKDGALEIMLQATDSSEKLTINWQ